MNYFDKLRKKRTFLVEDSRMLRDLLYQIFYKYQCPLQTTETAEEALEALARVEDNYDIIISDYRLPGIDGVGFLSESIQYQPQAFRVLMSGNLDRSLLSHASNFGVKGFIAKPFTIETFFSSLTSQMNGRPFNEHCMDFPLHDSCS